METESPSLDLLTPAEIATRMRVDPKTVGRWAKAGKLLSVRTAGGHRRFFAAEVNAIADGATPEEARKLAEAARAALKARLGS